MAYRAYRRKPAPRPRDTYGFPRFSSADTAASGRAAAALGTLVEMPPPEVLDRAGLPRRGSFA
jgi:hypothetical protein